VTEPRSLEGWAPQIADPETLAEVVERAFDYRGDVTVVLTEGVEVVGYLFNREREGAEPFVEIMRSSGGDPLTIPYARIRAITFTGKDTAAGASYAAWLRSREVGKADAPRSAGA
jgi:hypothetical protein